MGRGFCGPFGQPNHNGADSGPLDETQAAISQVGRYIATELSRGKPSPQRGKRGRSLDDEGPQTKAGEETIRLPPARVNGD